MKNVNFISVIIILLITGCGGKTQSTDDFISVDVTKSYPKRELILQDFMDVEYVALETTDDFLNQGVVLAVGKEIIMVKNVVNDGDIFVYDRKGKGLRKINRKGQGGEEYNNIRQIILDEDNREMFVNDYSNKILVYDLFGNFKRSFRYVENPQYSDIYNFDEESFICQDASFDNGGETGITPFVIISKQDGSIIKSIQISCQQKRPNQIQRPHSGMTVTAYVSNFPATSIIPYHESWLLTVYSNDTIFRFIQASNLIPFMLRTPSIESNDPKANLSLGILTERYYFLQTEKNEPEIIGTTPYDAKVVFAKTYLMYDKQETSIYEYTVYNDDYSPKISVNMSSNTANDEIAFSQKLEAYALVESYKKSELKGKLKEIAATLDEEDNPVIMLVKYKQ